VGGGVHKKKEKMAKKQDECRERTEGRDYGRCVKGNGADGVRAATDLRVDLEKEDGGGQKTIFKALVRVDRDLEPEWGD